MKKILLVSGIAVLATFTQAAEIRSTTNVLLNTAGEFVGGGELVHALNQDGLFTNYVDGVTDYDSYIASNPLQSLAFANSEWFSAPGTGGIGGTVILDLGALYNVSGMALWSEDSTGTRGVTITTATDVAFTTAQGAGTYFPTNNPLNVDYGPDNYLFSVRTAQYIRLDFDGQIKNNGYDGIAVGEMAFRTEAVPEPVSMTVLALGLAGAVAKRRRK